MRALLQDLGIDEEAGLALSAQILRALEAGARPAKRRGNALAKPRALATRAPASGVGAGRLIPLVLAVRDAMKAPSQGARPTRARIERIERSADAALRGIASRVRDSRAERRKKSAAGDAGSPAELISTREVMRRLVALTPDAVLTVRASGRLGLWNAAASRMSGRRRWEVQRRGLASLFKDPGSLDEIIGALEERGRIARYEATVVAAGGEEVPVRIFGARLKAPRAEPEGGGESRPRRAEPDRFLLLLHDLTEVQHIRRRLIETEKLSAMAKIAGSVAHEFRNPLNSLFLSTDLLEDELEGHDSVQKSIAPTLAAIREEIERLNQIITHYLALSKISTSSPEVVDVREAVEAFAADYQAHAADDDVTMRVRSDEGDHAITADPNQLRRILVNLVENAVDAVAGMESAEERPRRRGTVTLQVRRMRRSVKLTVKDNGPGIPDELRERVFEPFFTSKAGGSGLGLYLVREIALASQGTMSLSSAVGRGTSVSIRWPFAEDATDDA